MKPSEQITAALNGAALSELDAASLSALRFHIYKIACVVLAQPSKSMQREEIERHPPEISELVRIECRRVYDLRNGK